MQDYIRFKTLLQIDILFRDSVLQTLNFVYNELVK